MAKRGEKQPWKVRFEYENGICGQRAFTDEWSAEHAAEKIRENGERRELAVTVEVFHA